MALVVAIQSNGEHILYEKWVHTQWLWGWRGDPELTRFLDTAVVIEDWHNRQLRALLPADHPKSMRH